MEPEQTEQRAREYQRKQLQYGLWEEISTILFLIVWVWIAPIFVAQFSEYGRYPLLIVTAVVVYLTYQAALFIFDYLSGYQLEHRYNLSTETFGKWLWRHFKSISLGGLLLGALLVLLYTAVWYVNYWYLWAWGVFVLFSIVMSQLFPVLILPIFYKSTRMENPSLHERFERLSEGTGIRVEGVYQLDLSETTKKANAMLAGIGRTRRVLLSDTLLEGMSEEQIEVVYAHELGHHVFHHFRKNLTLHALVSVILFFLIYLVLGPFAGPQEDYVGAVARLPILALVLALFSFVWRPVTNAISRHFEIQCDRYALKKTGSPEHFIGAFEKLAQQNLADPDPPRWVVWLYYDHPPVPERIELARKMQATGEA